MQSNDDGSDCCSHIWDGLVKLTALLIRLGNYAAEHEVLPNIFFSKIIFSFFKGVSLSISSNCLLHLFGSFTANDCFSNCCFDWMDLAASALLPCLNSWICLACGRLVKFDGSTRKVFFVRQTSL